MVLPGLDGSLRQVAAMVVWGDELESHVSVTNLCALGIRDFVIHNLVFWDDALKFHLKRVLANRPGSSLL